MAETPTKRDQQREERRKQILDAALAVFSQRGYHATNVSDVAAQAGVSQGTIYWYFESKDALFTAALSSYFVDFGTTALAEVEDYSTAVEKFRALAESMRALAEGAEGLFTLFVGYWASSPNPEETATFWVDLLTEFKDVLVGIIEEGIERGEFRPVDAEALVWALMAAYDGLAAYLMLMPDLDLGRATGVFVETLLEGLISR